MCVVCFVRARLHGHARSKPSSRDTQIIHRVSTNTRSRGISHKLIRFEGGAIWGRRGLNKWISTWMGHRGPVTCVTTLVVPRPRTMASLRHPRVRQEEGSETTIEWTRHANWRVIIEPKSGQFGFFFRCLRVPSLTFLFSLLLPYATLQGTELKKGVVTGDDYLAVLNHARANGYAIPAVNCTMSPIINSCLEAAKKANAPMIIQFSNGGGAYMAGKGLKNEADQKAAVMGCVAGALHVRALAEFYGVPVILHTDHCSKALLPWFDGLLEANEEYFAKHGEPLFSSHMLDLSEESIEENMEISAKYLKRMAAINCFLEVEIGITGGEEDGVDNTDANPEDLYSKPEEIHQVYQALNPVAPGMFSIAAAFGNVHGVYSPGNVKLTPPILKKGQEYIKEKEGLDTDKPVYFVFHGGSGSSREDIREAIGYGVIKMNIDTDTQWSFWDGVKDYVADKSPYLQGQIGNPDGPEKPNKKYYDPRMWSREAETYTCNRLLEAYEDLCAVDALSK